MKVRFATADDDSTLDRMLDNNRGHDVRLACDRIFVTGDRPTGLIVYRPCAYVHELLCGRDLLSRKRAIALTDFAVRDGISKGLQGAIFVVKPDNRAMIRFLEEFGFIRQTDPGDLVYTWRPGLQLTKEQWTDAAENPELEEED